MIDSKTKLNMILGYPLEHSFSPFLHNKIYTYLNYNAVFLAHSTFSLSESIRAAKAFSIGYMAITMPYKEAILDYVDEISDEVLKLKSANTLLLKNGNLSAFNTDLIGIEYALKEVTITNKNVLIVGAGGAARTLAYFLTKKNAKIFFLNRTKNKAEKLANEFSGQLVEKNELKKNQFDLIINTTPLGLFPNVQELPIENFKFHSEQTVFDMIYHPSETAFLQQANSQGAKCISGLDMFLVQGIKQVELYLNQSIYSLDLLRKLKNDLMLYEKNEVTK